MNIKEFTVTLNLGTAPRVELDVIGDQIRCVECDTGFGISIDGGPVVPFGIGRALRLPAPFRRLAFIYTSDTISGGDVPIRVVVSLGVDEYSDARVAMFGSEKIKLAGFSDVVSADIVHTALGVENVGLKPGQQMINVRNTDATRTIRVGCAGLLGNPAINAGLGLILEPGENADFPLGKSGNFPNGVPLQVYAGAAGVTYTVTWFIYS